MAHIPSVSLRYIINHVVLPPQLPSSAEPQSVVTEAEDHLLQLTLESLLKLLENLSFEEKAALQVLEKGLRNWIAANAGGRLSTDVLSKWLVEACINGIISVAWDRIEED